MAKKKKPAAPKRKPAKKKAAPKGKPAKKKTAKSTVDKSVTDSATKGEVFQITTIVAVPASREYVEVKEIELTPEYIQEHYSQDRMRRQFHP